ncbi:MAG TPA: glycosyltransferase family 1 protein [Burkholderiaceae bacterium]
MSKSSLRIAMISEHASPLATLGGVDAGGQNIYVAHVARCLARAGHCVDVLTRRDDPHLPPVVDLRPGARVIHIDAGPSEFVPKERLLGHMPAFAQAAARLVRNSLRYDLVHANFFMSGWVAQQLHEMLGIPFAITFHALGLVRLKHQGTADAFPPERIAIERELVRRADAIVAECPQDRYDLLDLYQADPQRVRIVPCGFDPHEFAPMNRADARAKLGLAPDEFIVLQLGRIVPRKGIDDVVRAMALLPASMNARLLVVGGDSAEPDEARTPEFARLRGIACDGGVASRVVFTGHRSRAELRTYYAAADAFVTTPWYEPFGITPLEAMACAVPVIGSAVGGIKSTVLDGETGFLVPPHDPVALAAKLQLLHANPLLARAMGRSGLRRARSRYTWERITDELLEVYAGVLSASPAVKRAAPARLLASVAHAAS